MIHDGYLFSIIPNAKDVLLEQSVSFSSIISSINAQSDTNVFA